MSLRFKLILAFLCSSLITLAVMGGVAYERLERRFGDIVEAASARNFRGDVAAYWLTYGSWEAGTQAEPFTQFVGRRRALISARGGGMDTGDADAAEAIPPWRPGGMAGQGPGGPRPPWPGPPEGDSGESFRPLFRFTLFAPDGRVLNRRDPAQPGPPRLATPEERAKAVPVVVKGVTVAYAVSQGNANYTATDRAYLAAMQNALAWGIGAAALIAVFLGVIAGRRVSRVLAPFTQAIAGMRDGVLRQEVPVTSRDEIGLLAQAFNRMSQELAQSHEALHDSYRQISAQAQELYEVSIRDGLTKLYNRRYFDEVATQLAAQSAADGTPLTLALADIDFFKRINDGFSHAMGDAVLRQVADILQQETRPQDRVARYGGEEFVLAFPKTGLTEATAIAERLRSRIEAYPWADLDPRLTVTLSLGLAAHVPGQSAEETVKAADRKLYEAKNQGRNRVCL